MSKPVFAPRRRRRMALAAALAIVAFPFVTSSAADAATATCPEGSPACVIVRIVTTEQGVEHEESSYAVVLDQATADVTDEEYAVRSKPKAPPTTFAVPWAWSIEKVLDNDSATGVHFSETQNAKNFPAVLDADELRGSDAFDDGLVPAIYLTDANEISYVRPLRPSETDVNADDVFTLPPDTPLTLTLHQTGYLLTPTIKKTPAKVTTKTPVSFSATITPDTDEQLLYEWNFTGQGTVQSRKAAPTHTYSKSGTYSVNLSVRGEDGSYGRAATKIVNVGKPPKPPKPPSTNGGGGGGGTGGTVGGGGGYIPPYVPNNPGIDLPPTVENPPTDTAPTTPTDDGLEAVEGFVLTGAGAGQGDSIPGTQATSQPTKASELSTSRKIGGAVIGGLAVILLLGLGAEIETRWASTRLAHLRRRP